MCKVLAKGIRILTTAPIVAALLLTILHLCIPGAYAGPAHYWMAMACLSFLPLLAYPISDLVPALRKKGRDGQRTLGVIFSVIGYVIDFSYVLLFGGAAIESVVAGTYLFSGLLIALCAVLHLKPSAHACGESGPVAMLCYFLGPWFALGYLLLAAVFWSSLTLKRHSLPQLLAGSVIPVLALCASIWIFRL